jgi:hypothetical protein
MLGVPSKAGKIPTTRFMTGSLSSEGRSLLRLTVDRANDYKTFREVDRSGGRIQTKIEASGGRRLTQRYAAELSRALIKSALECAWLDHGEETLDPSFDGIRSAVLDESRDGFIVMLKQGEPETNSVEISYDLTTEPTHKRLSVVANYFGLSIATDSHLPSPLIELPKEHVILKTFRLTRSSRQPPS